MATGTHQSFFNQSLPVRGGKDRGQVVDAESSRLVRHAVHSEKSRPDHCDRYIQVRLGQSSGRPRGLWFLQWAQKHINWLLLQAVFPVPGDKYCSRGSYRHHCPELYQQAGWNCFLVSLQVEPGSLGLVLPEGTVLCTTHLAGTKKVLSDALSRDKVALTEWMLNCQVVKAVFQRVGSPHVDLLASKHNHQLAMFYSQVPSLSSSGVNALTQNWDMNSLLP